jgi:farnesyl-diphosphate farnesyltransferase
MPAKGFNRRACLLPRRDRHSLGFSEGCAITDFDALLVKTSRTFALSIPALEEPLRREVGLAYLLFRIADTFEDAYAWPASRRAECLEEFARLVEARDAAGAESASERWLRDRPTEHAGYRELLVATPAVIEAYSALAPESSAAIAGHVGRTCRGMARFVALSDDGKRVELRDVESLRDYCYVVAGIVGELLTELFLIHDPALAGHEAPLRARAAAFGEALQLVNILKDSAADAAEGRRFLPPGVDRAPVFDLARRDLERAAEYVRELQAAGAQRGTVAFTALPLLLASETLARVEQAGPGAKVSRQRVQELVAALDSRLASGVRVV